MPSEPSAAQPLAQALAGVVGAIAAVHGTGVVAPVLIDEVTRLGQCADRQTALRLAAQMVVAARAIAVGVGGEDRTEVAGGAPGAPYRLCDGRR